jgi:hypothetical protein
MDAQSFRGSSTQSSGQQNPMRAFQYDNLCPTKQYRKKWPPISVEIQSSKSNWKKKIAVVSIA